MPLAQLSAGFQSLPLLPTSKLGPSGADSQVGGFMYILGPCGSLQWTLVEARSFSFCVNPHKFFSEILRLYFSALELWVSRSVLLPSCSSRLSTHNCGTARSTNHRLTPSASHLAVSPFQSSCPSPPLLPVWMNVYSLTLQLVDFHTV